jgi:hypothetical protein
MDKRKRKIFREIRKNIIKGVQLAYKKLVISKAKQDGELILSRNGKVVRVKAKDLLT